MERDILKSLALAFLAGATAGGALRLWLAPQSQGQWFALILLGTLPRLAVWAFLRGRDRARWRVATIGFEGGAARALAHGTAVFSLWSFFLAGASGPSWSWEQRLGGVFASCVAGFFEEFAFRGLALTAFLGLMPRGAAVLATALAFTASHCRPESIPSWPHIFLTGAVFANLRLRGLGLGWLALIHAAVDAAFFFVGYEGGPRGPRYALFVGGLFAYAALSFPGEGAGEGGLNPRPAGRLPGSDPSPG